MPSRSIVPYFALMAVFFAVAERVVRSSRFYERVTSSAGQKRFASLDGLRGILALGVFFHHAVMTQSAYVTGRWGWSEGFYRLLGPPSVHFFFMITGFLFWLKAIRNRGRIDALALWRNRILRIAPMCLFTVVVMLALAAAQSRFRLHEPAGELATHVLGCLSLGVMLPDVNGEQLSVMNAGVFWTLRYEWCFYLAFPLIAWCATPRKLAGLCLLAATLLLAAEWYGLAQDKKGLFFLLGMIAAQLVAVDRLGGYFRSTAWSLLGLALATAVAASCPSQYGNLAFMFVVFLAIAYDSDLFAFLRWQPARFLGAISYSIYLIHAIVLYLVFRGVDGVVSVAALGSQAFWGLVFLCGLLTILISAVTYRWVEHPFLVGRRSTIQVFSNTRR